MKIKILLTIILLGGFSTLNASHVRWFSNFEKAHKESLKQNKPLMILLIKKNCPACIKSLKTTFINQSYIDNINKKFIPVLITKNQKQSYPIEMLYTLIYPTLFFLDEQELFYCEPIRGEITPQRLENHLNKCE